MLMNMQVSRDYVPCQLVDIYRSSEGVKCPPSSVPRSQTSLDAASLFDDEYRDSEFVRKVCHYIPVSTA